MSAIREIWMFYYLPVLYLIMLIINAGLFVSKKLIGMTGWWWTINTFKFLHICGEKLSRHIRRVIPE